MQSVGNAEVSKVEAKPDGCQQLDEEVFGVVRYVDYLDLLYICPGIHLEVSDDEDQLYVSEMCLINCRAKVKTERDTR